MKGVIYIAIVSAFVVILGASAMYVVESEAEDTQIHTWLDAFWWASATATTVGYGDIVPVTETGRIIGIAMMYVGIAIIGSLISTVGATLIGAKMDKTGIADDTKSLLISKIEELEKLEKKDIDILKNMIDSLHADIKQKKS
jgi:voltage-gated potassium channel Kch